MEERKTGFQQLDYTLLFLLFVLMCFSLLAIYSGSGQYHSDPMHYVKLQLIWFAIGLVAMAFVMLIDYDLFRNFSVITYSVGIVSLLLVSYSPLGVFKNGATRWLNMGVTDFQPSEVMKIFLIVALAHLLYRVTLNRPEKKDLKADLITVAKLFGIGLPPFFLILKQPDLGTALVIASIIGTMLLVSGVAWRIITLIGVSAVGGLISLVWLHNNYFDLFSKIIEEHQLERIYGWLDPYEYQGSFGYQLVMAMRGIGSGQLYGSGFMHGVQTQSDQIPEIHTDFVFTVIGEEFGFIGATVLIVTYFLMFYRMIIIALTCNNLFGTYLVSGVIGLLVFQVFQNIAMTIGLMPITGIALPFISYGGTSLLTNMIAVGIVLNVNMRTRHYMFETEDKLI